MSEEIKVWLEVIASVAGCGLSIIKLRERVKNIYDFYKKKESK